MKIKKSPCGKCDSCKNPDSYYAACKTWREWFGGTWQKLTEAGKKMKGTGVES